MIKLTDLLREIEAESKEQEIIDDLLGTLNEGAFDDLLNKAKDYAKKGLLTAGVIAALIASPKLSSAQKIQIKDIAKTTQTDTTSKDSIRTTTPVDGIIGSVTSQFMFPSSVRISTTLAPATRQTPSSVSSSTTEQGFDYFKNLISTNLTDKQMSEWNDFVKWMKNNNYSGNTKMDQGGFDKKILNDYKNKVNSDFWVSGEEDIKEVQKAHKEYRKKWIDIWKMGIEGAKQKGITPRAIMIGGERMDPTNPSHVSKVEKEFQPWSK